MSIVGSFSCCVVHVSHSLFLCRLCVLVCFRTHIRVGQAKSNHLPTSGTRSLYRYHRVTPHVVVTDASGLATGGALMQDQGQGLHPLAFMSQALKPTEQWYSAYKRELVAIAYCFIQWRHYLEGYPVGVPVMTDHKPLTLLMDQQVLSRSQTRWIRLGLFQSI